MRKNLRNLKIIFVLLTIMTAMCMFVGCGNGKQDDSAMPPEQENRSAEQSADTGNDEEQVNGEEQKSDTKEGQDKTEQSQPEDTQDQPERDPADKSSNAAADEGTSKSSDVPVNEKSDTSPDGSAELSVDVESIGDHSVVGNKITIESSADGNHEIMVVGVGEDNKELISIYFEEDASYVYQTIRNGGADVETREGSFSDIEISMTLHLKGYYKGDDFYANEVTISKVILN